MTTQSYRLKLARVNSLKLKSDVRIPATLEVENFLTLVKSSGIYTFGVDYELIGEVPVVDPVAAMIVILDRNSGSYKLQSLSAIVASTTQIDQEIVDPGPASVLPNAGVVRVNQTVGAAITLDMPLSSLKTCPVLISDWKNDAGTNNITINLTGSDEFPGGLTSWTIGGNGGSVFLRPIPGVGYAL